MTVTEAKEKLNELELKEFAYNHAMGILYYDGTTGAPKMWTEGEDLSPSFFRSVSDDRCRPRAVTSAAGISFRSCRRVLLLRGRTRTMR